MKIEQLVLRWQDKVGAKQRSNLPWHSKDPYKIWVSEIMLQQTQVAVVRDYYSRFIQRFPKVENLARATQDEVMSLWAGLGYYARARNMHKAAGLVMTRHAGSLPDAIDVLRQLPGIGRSTAGAILSMGADKSYPVLDTNVKRVLIRFLGIQTPPGAALTKELWKQAEQLVPSQRCGDYNRAMMNLGSLVCRADKPRCDSCPLATRCLARRAGLTQQLPRRPQKAQKPLYDIFFALVINRSGEFLLRQRPPFGIWGGLWCPPSFESERQLTTVLREDYEDKIQEIGELPARKHTFSHCIWRIQPKLILATENPDLDVAEDAYLWYSIGTTTQQRKIAMPAPVAKLVKEIREHKECAKYFA